MFKKIRTFLSVLAALLLLLITAVAAVNLHVVLSTRESRFVPEDPLPETKADAILVLGARVYEDGRLCAMLEDRMACGVALYFAGAADKLLLSGDHGREDYDEVNAMKEYALAAGVPSEDIFTDHAGFSTYESLYRARDVFAVDSVIVVTQDFHLSRAVYDGRQLGLSVWGVASDPRPYAHVSYNYLREIPARTMDFLRVNLFRPKPKYLGEVIDIRGDGNATRG